jgi:ribonuclease P protein component
MSDPVPPRLGLGRAMRLQQKREFDRIRAHGRRTSKGCLIANWMTLPDGSLSKVGVVTSRKLGKAPIRTRARRLLRESFRLHQHDLVEPVAMVLVARASIVGCKLADVERDYLSFLRQASLLKANG